MFVFNNQLIITIVAMLYVRLYSMDSILYRVIVIRLYLPILISLLLFKIEHSV